MFSFVSGFFGNSNSSINTSDYIPSYNSWDEPEKRDGWFKPRPSLQNVGKFESMTDRSSDIFEIEPHTFSGVQLNAQNILHPNFVTAHTLALGKKENVDPWTDKKDDERSLYTYSSFLRTGHWSLNGRWSNNNLVRAVVQYDAGLFSATASGQFSADERKTAWETDAAITKNDWCVQFKLQGPAIGVSYTQPILPKYSMGSEFFFSPMNGLSRLKWIGKHENKEDGSVSTLSYTTGLGPDQFSLNYLKAIKKNLDIAAALDLSHEKKMWTSVFRFGYQLKHAHSSIKGMLDSTLKCICILEEPVMEDMFTITASVRMDYLKNVYDFGLGATMTM